ncbi:MAG: hypothetical protein CVU47_09020 [Chloroflexi bacterium HGW-Chloroflexi-9]|nr:MAG: hypothetical protein CVU47_09020 [Chloroflexi bacterium HGW-Chloroflexi-9]
MRYVVGFGRFWYDFIVGDSIVLALGGVATLVVGVLLVRAGAHLAGEVALPVMVVATLAASLPMRR